MSSRLGISVGSNAASIPAPAWGEAGPSPPANRGVLSGRARRVKLGGMHRGTRQRSRFWASLVALAIASQSATALGQGDSPDDLARRHFESGVAYLQEADYENALKAFEKAYELSKRPDLLLNIATVHERKGDFKAAVASLKKYLEVAPDSEQRATVEARITNLEKRAQEGTTEPPPTGPGETPGETPAGGPAPTGKPDQKGPVEAKSNVPAFVLLGIGGITAAGAVLTGVLANGEYNDAKDQCSPRCTDDDVSAGKTLALTSTILTGVAVVSASIGAVLYFTGKPASQEQARKPQRFNVGLGVAPGGAAAAASWRF